VPSRRNPPEFLAIGKGLTYILSELVDRLTLGRVRAKVLATHLFSNAHKTFGGARLLGHGVSVYRTNSPKIG
jgi:hypothetical protein